MNQKGVLAPALYHGAGIRAREEQAVQTLTELAGSYAQLLENADADGGPEEREFLLALEGAKAQVASKADAYAAVLAEVDGRIAVYEKEVERLQARARALRNNKARMMAALKAAMEAMGADRLEGALHRFRLVKNGGRQPMEITGDVPDSYARMTVEPDGELIRRALESGAELPFARLLPRGTHVRID